MTTVKKLHPDILNELKLVVEGRQAILEQHPEAYKGMVEIDQASAQIRNFYTKAGLDMDDKDTILIISTFLAGLLLGARIWWQDERTNPDTYIREPDQAVGLFTGIVATLVIDLCKTKNIL